MDAEAGIKEDTRADSEVVGGMEAGVDCKSGGGASTEAGAGADTGTVDGVDDGADWSRDGVVVW